LDMLTRPKLIQHLQRWLKRTATLRSPTSDPNNVASSENNVLQSEGSDGGLGYGLMDDNASRAAREEASEGTSNRIGAVYTDDSSVDVGREDLPLHVDVNYSSVDDAVSPLLSSPEENGRPSFTDIIGMQLEEDQDEEEEDEVDDEVTNCCSQLLFLITYFLCCFHSIR